MTQILQERFLEPIKTFLMLDCRISFYMNLKTYTSTMHCFTTKDNKMIYTKNRAYKVGIDGYSESLYI